MYTYLLIYKDIQKARLGNRRFLIITEYSFYVGYNRMFQKKEIQTQL